MLNFYTLYRYSLLHLTQAQQVHSMFPHVPLQAITLDLADTHSVSLTVDRVLNNTIYIPDRQQLQGEESASSSEPHPATPSHASSSNMHTPSHHGSMDVGESSDQEASGTSSESRTTSFTSSQDSSETPEQSTRSSSQSNESDNAHSDSSALEEGSRTVRRRVMPIIHRTVTADSTYSSTGADTSDSRMDTSSVENRLGPVLSNPADRTEDIGRRQFNGRTGEDGSVPYAGVGLFSRHKTEGGGDGARLGVSSHGSFSSLQQRKEEMLKNARQ